MDHSFSVDTCIYNSDSLNKDDPKGSDKTKREDDIKLAKRIEEELGIAGAGANNAETDSPYRTKLFKKVLDGFSKMKLSKQMDLLKGYLQFRTEFEYSDSSVDNFTDDKPKEEFNSNLSEVSTSVNDSQESSLAEPVLSKFSVMSPRHDAVKKLKTPEGSPRANYYSSIDDKIMEKVFTLFVDTTNNLALKAVENNQHVLTDKLVCNVFRMLKWVYEEDLSNDFSRFLDAQGIHPLFNVDFNIPAKTPQEIRSKIQKMATDPSLKNTIAERAYMFQFLEKFKLLDLYTMCLSHKHPLVAELWNLCVDTVLNKRAHDWDKLYICRNCVFESEARSKLDKHVQSQPRPSADDSSAECSESPSSSKMNSEHNLSETSRSATQTDLLAGAEPVAPGKQKDMWAKDVYISNSRVLSYILETNRTLDQARVDVLRAHFNFNDNRTPGTWVREPNNQLPTFCLIEKKGVSIKVRGKLPCDIITALSIISDSELATEWVPFSKDSKDLKIFTKTSRIFKQVYDYPMIGHKETLFHGLSTNLLDEANCVIISCSNPPASKKEAEHIMKTFREAGLQNSDYLTIDAKSNFAISGYTTSKVVKKNQKSGDILFVLFPYSENETLMEAYGNVIQDVKIVPMKFVVYIAKKMILGMFKKVSAICKNFKDSKFAKSIEERSEFCAWIRGVYSEYRVNNPQSFVFDPAAATYLYSLSPGRRKFK